MKIFVLGTRGFPDVQGGIEKHCEELYPRLVKLGCQVTVIARSPYIPREKQVSSWEGVNFVYLKCPRLKSLETITHTFLGLIFTWLNSPDILHIHGIGPAILAPLVKLMRLKLVITHHGPDYKRKKWRKGAKFFLRLGEYWGVKFADKVIAISRGIKELLETKFRKEGIHLIPNGVNILPRIPPGETLEKYRLKAGRYIFTACRFVPEKGLEDLILAFKRIENPEFELVIAGGADHETAYSRKIRKIAQKTSGLILTGFIFGRFLKELYSQAALFILPSYYEGLPLALLEALSYELPVLVTDIPPHREIPLKEFRYFPPGNIDILSRKIVELFKSGVSQEEKKELGKLWEKDYNWDKIAEKIFMVYGSVN